MILLTGASGRIGSRVTELLLGQDVPLRAMSRTPDNVEPKSGFEIVYGDFEDQPSLDKAFSGVKTAVVISGQAIPGKRCFTHKSAFDAAKRAGVEHVIYLSLKGASENSVYPYSRDHYESEKFLAETGLSFSSLRNSFYLDMFFQKFGPDGIVRGPAGDGKGAFITREDAAQAVVSAALNPPVGIVELTGSEALSLNDVAERFSNLIGRKLEYNSESVDVARARLQGSLNDELNRELEIGWFDAIEKGEQMPVTANFEQLTGKAPHSIETYFAEFPFLFESLKRTV